MLAAVETLLVPTAPERLRLALRESEQRTKGTEAALQYFRAALDASVDIVFLVDFRHRRFVDFNESACRQLGYTRAQLLALWPGAIRVDRTQVELEASFEQLVASDERSDVAAAVYRRRDGSTFPVELRRAVHETPEGPILVVSARDLTERREADERQAQNLRYQEALARFGHAALARRDPKELIADAVAAVREALSADEVVYVDRNDLSEELQSSEPFVGSGKALPFDWAHAFASAATVAVRGDNVVRGALCTLSRREDAYWANELGFLRTAASLLSTGLQRIASEGQVAYLAQFDTLTGLANRTLLMDRFAQMIVQAKRHGSRLAVLFIDLDGFKLVNDSLGHAAGDELLAQIARRLQDAIRPGDTVARVSGDEFAVVLADLARPEDAALVAQKILDGLAQPIALGESEAFVTASVGIAGFPGDGQDVEVLLAAADSAMYRAKQSGRNAYQFFTSEITQRTRARASLAFELHRALERDEFTLAYQPKVDLASARICGTEALLRWRHPQRGVVPPMEFIPALEQSGLIVPVGEWAIRRACSDLRGWAEQGLRPLPVAVNLSARQFRQRDLDARIRDLVAAGGVDPALIELEITESQLMEDPEHAIRMMRSLQESGIGIAIDDFGTGYSSLSYLTRFPLKAVKIDRSFVADVFSDHADAAIVRTIIDMAHILGFTVVAEGVETDRQAAFLRQFGCEQAQGYLFARPMPAAEVGALITH